MALAWLLYGHHALAFATGQMDSGTAPSARVTRIASSVQLRPGCRDLPRVAANQGNRVPVHTTNILVELRDVFTEADLKSPVSAECGEAAASAVVLGSRSGQ